MSKKVEIILGVVTLLAGPALAAPPPSALPDLAVTEVRFESITTYQNAQGRTCFNFLVGYTIKNQGPVKAGATGARMDVTAMNTGEYTFFSSVSGSGPLAPGATASPTVQPASAQNWCFDSPHKAKVRITIDPPDGTHPRGNVHESIEDNNSREREFEPSVRPSKPIPVRP